VSPSLLVGKLAGHPRQNHLFVALREIGRIERFLFTLEWLQNPELRRRVTLGLNKGEARHTLKRAIRFYRLGSVSDRTQLDQDLNAMPQSGRRHHYLVEHGLIWTAHFSCYQRKELQFRQTFRPHLPFGLGTRHDHRYLSLEWRRQNLGKVPTSPAGRHRIAEGQHRLTYYSCRSVRSGLNTNLVKENSDDMLRLAVLSCGHSGRMTGPPKLAQAVAELGRIEKTIHSLTYIDDESKRRRTLTQLNRGEDRHKLARAVFHGKRGELRQRYRGGAARSVGCPTPKTNAC
jgi:hypothetical protein